MTQEQFLLKILDLLDKAGIPHMISGSIASSIHGQPRATADVDIVVDPAPRQLETFLTLVGDELYLSPEGAREAVQRRSMFNVIDAVHGWKADLIVRKPRPFSSEEFRRRRRVSLAGREVDLVSPEDAILSKLEWSREAASERQFLDALAIALLRRDELDCEYLKRWSYDLGVQELLERLLREARLPSA